MAKSDKSYRVAHGFYAEVKKSDEYPKGGRVFFTRANEHRVTELLTQDNINAQVSAGNLAEGPTVAESDGLRGEVTAPSKKES